jgi:hypothetical protein
MYHRVPLGSRGSIIRAGAPKLIYATSTRWSGPQFENGAPTMPFGAAQQSITDL